MLWRGGKNIQLYKNGLNDPDNHSSVVTYLEPDILECEVKWALGSITMNNASGGDGIPAKLFQILEDDAGKVLDSTAHLENSAVVTGLEKVSFHSNPNQEKWKWSEVAQSCPTLCDPINCSLPCSSIHWTFHARVLVWVAISFSRGASWPRDWTHVSCIADILYLWATR